MSLLKSLSANARAIALAVQQSSVPETQLFTALRDLRQDESLLRSMDVLRELRGYANDPRVADPLAAARLNHAIDQLAVRYGPWHVVSRLIRDQLPAATTGGHLFDVAAAGVAATR